MSDDFLTRVNQPHFARDLEKALREVKDRPYDRHCAVTLARLLWGGGGYVLTQRGALRGAREIYLVGKRASVATATGARDLAFAELGRGPDYARAFAEARQRGKEATAKIAAAAGTATPRRPLMPDESEVRCRDPLNHRVTWIQPEGVIGGPVDEPQCSACYGGH